jgi:biopolymer transport protein ExbB
MWEFFSAGGPFMVFLVLTSVVAVTFIIERGLALRWPKVIPRHLEDAVENCETPEDLEELKRQCEYPPSALGRLLLLATEHLPLAKAENVDTLQTYARHEVLQLERGLVVLEIVVGIAPLLGLVGTIHGLSTLFNSGVNDNAAFAKGISEVLNTTLMGLLIAIPSLVAWSYYNKKVETLTVEMERLCDEFLRRQYRRKKKI